MSLRRTGTYLLSLLLTGMILSSVAAILLYVRIEPQLPSIERLRDVRLQVPLRIYSRDHRLIAEFGEKRRDPVAMEDVPEQLVQAFLAAEDDHFYQHSGVDFPGLVRAAVELVRTGEKRQGGSTITMQVARNFFLSSDKTYMRKLTEILLAFRIEDSLSKQEILELYFNKIYLGHRAYGVQAAAQIYYGKTVDQLTLPQAAMIAALPKAPSRVNPISNRQAATDRRNYVLGRMLKLGYIDGEQYAEAAASVDDAVLHTVVSEVEAPYLAEMVRSELYQQYGEELYTSGLEVVTTLDGAHQAAANSALRNALLDYTERHGYRGPEGHVELAGLPEEERSGLLSGYAVSGGLLPALVTGVREQEADVLLADGTSVVLGWDALSWANRYLGLNRFGNPPQRATDVLAAGDIVRLRTLADGKFRLSQVPAVSGALVALSPQDGAILALVGGFDFSSSKFNRVTQARRQPGSGFKPFVYSAALEKGFTPATMINDAPVVFDDSNLESTWRPENYSGQFYGPTRLREALYRSRNLVSIRILRAIGPHYAADYATRFGFEDAQLPKDLTLALGSASVTPLQMARGYAVLANGGYLIDPYFITEVRDAAGEELYRAHPAIVCPECEAEQEQAGLATAVAADAQPAAVTGADPAEVGGSAGTAEAAPAGEAAPPRLAPRVISDRNVWLMTSMMQDVIRRGTGVKARVLGRNDLAGKTGTTNDQKDAWFTGFSHTLVASTWVGFDQIQPLGRGETGGRAALPAWIDYMRFALHGVPEWHAQMPEGLVTVRIDPATGLLARSGQGDAIFETFMVETAPTKASASVTDVTGLDGKPETAEPLF